MHFAKKWWVSCTVYRIHKYGIQQKKIFKTGSHDTIHTYKIILLQSFQFLAINSIQTDPNDLFG